MAATAQALRLTDSYRVRLKALVRVADHEARQQFQDLDLDEISESYGPIRTRVANSVARAQTEAVRLTAGYLGAFLSTELGEVISPPTIAAAEYVGKSFGGLPLADSLDSPRIAMLMAIKEGQPDPRGTGLRVLLQNVDLDVKAAARAALADQIAADDRIEGWTRAIRGTCAACAGLAAEATSPPGTPLEIHPNCECVSEPVVTRAAQPSEHPRVEAPLLADHQLELERYVGGEGPNDWLRGTHIPSPAAQPTYKKNIEALEAAIASRGEKAPELYRLTTLDTFKSHEFSVGDLIVDDGFASSTQSKAEADGAIEMYQQMSEEHGTLGAVQFFISKARGLEVNRYFPENTFADQEEWLIQRGTRFRITEVEIDSHQGKPLIKVHLEYEENQGG
jgi:hypothetical protein